MTGVETGLRPLSAAQAAELHARAGEMRRNPTAAEKRLWRKLSGRQLDGLKFRRHAVIGRYVVDLFCAERALVVELDGEGADPIADALRDAALAGVGYRVIRLAEAEVLADPAAARATIAAALSTSSPRTDPDAQD